ncbi:stalk domain-containing protein [Paenibacillus sp. MER 99-2]|uniref:stalk domain-containing protein n=1 Tax=Paenibacillus sp. MER 99-2 TaxID=2939572 RepID=UPI00203EBDCA|nr:stalk domain-containing protein [Paenibacillus sp. MER 99-2]MCM3173830.1 stalk domain-containing protein [Paenibacillus sp. MER 99-2]
MKFRKMLLLSFISIFIFGNLGLHSAIVHAADSLEFREHDDLINILKDGDGENRVFGFTTKNKLTASNTTLRLYVNAIEVDSKDYVVDYANYSITLNKAPDRGAEIHIKYGIIPGFEWGEGGNIGVALPEGDGSTRNFPVSLNYTLNSTKQISLSIDQTKVATSRFTFNATTNTVTLSEKQQVPHSGAKVYFYIPKASISSKPSPSEEVIESPVSSGAVDPPPDPASGSPSVTSPSPTPNKPSEPLVQIPTGESYPGSITIRSGNTITIKLSESASVSGYTSYLMVKNASGQVVRQIKIEPGKTSSFSLRKLGLPTGGYYFYLKSANQSVELSASIPQFVTINHKPKNIQVFIEGEKQVYKQPPTNFKGNILVPLRGIFESLGANVTWNSSTQTVTAIREGRTIVLTIGSKIAYINGVAVTLSAKPQIINGVTMVPLRFVSEAFGGEVEWHGEAGSVTIFLNKPSIPTSAESEEPATGATKTTESGSSSTSPILNNISKGINTPSDIIFVIDVTGSMGEVIDYIKETVKSFVDSVPAGSNFAVISYRDVNIYRNGDYNLKSFDFTQDKDKLKGYLNTLVASGGGDIKESGLEAINLATNKLSEFSSDNAKRIIFITDAPVHDSPPLSSFSIKGIAHKLKADEIVFDAIAPSYGDAYRQIIQLVKSTPGGALYDIKDASVLSLNK